MSESQPSGTGTAERLLIVEGKLDRLAVRFDRRRQLKRGFQRLGFLVGVGVVTVLALEEDSAATEEVVLGALVIGGAVWFFVALIGWAVEGFDPDIEGGK